MSVIGWDIGGVHVKAARAGGGLVEAVSRRAFSIERDLERLPLVLQELSKAVGARDGAVHAITMTGELSQRFRTKAEGVDAILAAHETAFPGADRVVLDVHGAFVTPADARRSPREVAASNWRATAVAVARRHPNCLLVDMGSTTTDIIPIVGGQVVPAGVTDPERLASGELVYSGAIRTPVEAIVRTVPWQGRQTGVSAEWFATTGDVHVWLGTLDPQVIEVPTADGRPATRPFAGERLARVVCADRTMIDEAGISGIARHVAGTQRLRIAQAIARVASRAAALRTAVVTGIGEQIAADAARDAGLDPVLLREEWNEAAEIASAAAVALLLETPPG